eukprot:TRINITY_DN38224_c0_g1_i2.p1 TRINITY_DN38224_c0_g1~~TRINITY_DN38224_c0_g1_i2.p1  ORF type:complete len:470 (+),score=124.15 TRINITY_DN38224_c0_g1_i2:83-1492(+)
MCIRDRYQRRVRGWLFWVMAPTEVVEAPVETPDETPVEAPAEVVEAPAKAVKEPAETAEAPVEAPAAAEEAVDTTAGKPICYGAYRPPVPIVRGAQPRDPSPRRDPLKGRRRRKRRCWNSTPTPAPQLCRELRWEEAAVQRNHSNGERLREETDAHLREGRFEEGLRCLRRARTMFARSKDSKLVRALQKPREALLKRAVGVAAALVDEADLALADDARGCQESAKAAHRILLWVAKDEHNRTVAAKARADALKVGKLWVGCSYSLANQALERAHAALLAGEAGRTQVALSVGEARLEYMQLLETGLAMEEETKQRLQVLDDLDAAKEYDKAHVEREVDAALEEADKAMAATDVPKAEARLRTAKYLHAAIKGDEGWVDVGARVSVVARRLERLKVERLITAAGFAIERHAYEDCERVCSFAYEVLSGLKAESEQEAAEGRALEGRLEAIQEQLVARMSTQAGSWKPRS